MAKWQIILQIVPEKCIEIALLHNNRGIFSFQPLNGLWIVQHTQMLRFYNITTLMDFLVLGYFRWILLYRNGIDIDIHK